MDEIKRLAKTFAVFLPVFVVATLLTVAALAIGFVAGMMW